VKETGNMKKAIKQKNSIIAQWMLPMIIFFFLVALLLMNYGITMKKTVEDALSEKLEGNADYYAVTFATTINNFADIVEPAVNLIEGVEFADMRSVRLYMAALQDSGSVSDVWLVGEDYKGINAKGDEIILKDQAIIEAMEAKERTYVFTTKSGVTDRAVVYVCPLKDKEEMLISYYDTTQFQLNVGAYVYDRKSSFAIVDGDGEVMYYQSKIEKDGYSQNLLDTLSKATLERTTYATIVKSMVRRESFDFMVRKDDGSGEHYTMTPIGLNDWYFVLCLPEGQVNLMFSSSWKNTRTAIICLSVALVLFLTGILFFNIFNGRQNSTKNKELEEKADTDLLTELNNKMATERKIKEHLEAHPDEQGMMFVMDIDNFKKINDTMGHAFGDKVLKGVGDRLRAEFRATDILGRAGGDEFIVFLKNIGTDELLLKESRRMANVFKDFKAGEYTKYSVTASIGCAIYPRDASDFESLYKAADQGLYKAKKAGKNCLAFYKDLEK